MHAILWPLLLAVVVISAGCARTPLDTDSVDPELTIGDVQADPEATRHTTVIWAGVVAAARNLEDSTMIEVVAYPMDRRSQRPRVEEAPIGRFLVYAPGYVETAELPQGRRITVRGRTDGTEDGEIGEAPYRYPVLRAEALELWPRRPPAVDSGPRIHFGIGIMFSN